MKKELRNVFTTFAVIGVVSFGVAQFFNRQELQLSTSQKVLEREFNQIETEVANILEERSQSLQQVALKKQEEMILAEKAAEDLEREIEVQALAKAKSREEAQVIKEANLAVEMDRLAAIEKANEEAKLQADLLAAEQAAKKLADQKAAQKAAELAAAEAAAKKATRKSRAS